MSPVHVDAVVRLKEDIPSLGLRCGDEGVVLSVWLSPSKLFYEVTFARRGQTTDVRTLLSIEQLEVVQ